MDKKEIKAIWKEMGSLTDNLTAIAKSIKKQDEIIAVILDIVKKQTRLIKNNTEMIGTLGEVVKKLGNVPKTKKESYIA